MDSTMGTQHQERISPISLTGRSGIIFHSILYSIHYLACDFVPFHAFPTTRFMTQPAFHNLYTKTFLLPCPANHSLPCLLQLYLQLRWLETKQVLGARCVCQLPACLRKLWWLGLRYCTRRGVLLIFIDVLHHPSAYFCIRLQDPR